MIFRKARSADPERRYPDATELLADLERWLDHRPISVRKPSLHYKLGCFAKRNPWFTSAALLAVFAFAGGFASTAWSLARAERSSKDAQWGVAFFRGWLEESDPTGGPGPTIPFDQALVRAAERLDESQPPAALEADLRHSFGVALLNSGHPKIAEQHLRLALDLRRDELGPDAPGTLDTQVALGYVLLALDRAEEALQLGQDAERRRIGLPRSDSEKSLRTAFLVARAQVEGRLVSDPIATMRELLRRCESAHGEGHPQTAAARSNLGNAFARLGRWDEATVEYRRVLEWRLGAFGEDHVLTHTARNSLGTGLVRTGKLEEARQQLELAQAGMVKAIGADHPITLGARSDWAVALRYLGRFEEASELLESIVVARRRVLGANHTSTLESKINLLSALMFAARSGDQELSSVRWKRVDRLFQELQESRKQCDSRQLNLVDSKFAEVQAFHRRWSVAAEAFDRALKNNPQANGGYPNLYLEGRSLHARWMADLGGSQSLGPPADLLDCIERLREDVGSKSAYVAKLEGLLLEK